MTAPAFSLVIPAYNESSRLGRTLADVARWLEAPPRAPVEVVLSDDGSSDDTLQVMRAWAETRPAGQVQVLANLHRGKAATVSSGILAARGELILFSDADLSTPLAEATKLIAAIEGGAGVAIGSRELTGARREGEPFYRHVMGRGFNYLVQALLVRGIRDTQCGFKMFRRDAGHAIFQRLRRYGPDAGRRRGTCAARRRPGGPWSLRRGPSARGPRRSGGRACGRRTGPRRRRR